VAEQKKDFLSATPARMSLLRLELQRCWKKTNTKRRFKHGILKMGTILLPMLVMPWKFVLV